MFRSILILLLIFIASASYVIYKNSEKTFEAQFKNIDGLPNGAKVTALGVTIGKVIRTKPIEDGVVVTVKITNKSFSYPEPGSQLTITSFRPNQGRVLEVIPPDKKLAESKAWIVREPITTESWLHASLELGNNLKDSSEKIIKELNPENIEKAKTAFIEASRTLRQLANHLHENEEHLNMLQERFSQGGGEAAALLLRLHKPIDSLSQIVSNDELIMSFGVKAGDFVQNLDEISNNINKPEFVTNIGLFKTKILDHLNTVNSSLIVESRDLNNSELKQKIKIFSSHVDNLNTFYENLSKKDIRKSVIDSAKKARTVTTELEQKTEDYWKLLNTKQN